MGVNSQRKYFNPHSGRAALYRVANRKPQELFTYIKMGEEHRDLPINLKMKSNFTNPSVGNAMIAQALILKFDFDFFFIL